MSTTIHTPETAPEASKEILTQIKGKYGFVPNLMGSLANSAPVIESYVQLGEQFGKTSLSPQEAQVVYLTVNFENDCH